jgi:hypothetical protein
MIVSFPLIPIILVSTLAVRWVAKGKAGRRHVGVFIFGKNVKSWQSHARPPGGRKPRAQAFPTLTCFKFRP